MRITNIKQTQKIIALPLGGYKTTPDLRKSQITPLPFKQS
jgi:hypothetical protein